MKNLLISTLIIFLFVVGGSVFYRYVVYLPKVEQQKVDLDQQRIKKKEARGLEINTEYDQCILEAKENFKNKMNMVCSTSRKQHNEKYEKCLANGKGLLRDLCESELGGYLDPNQCRIPKSLGDSLISEREKVESQCSDERKFKIENNQ